VIPKAPASQHGHAHAQYLPGAQMSMRNLRLAQQLIQSFHAAMLFLLSECSEIRLRLTGQSSLSSSSTKIADVPIRSKLTSAAPFGWKLTRSGSRCHTVGAQAGLG